MSNGVGTNQTPNKFLLGAFGVLTAALTAFGAVSGTIDRIDRDHPVLFWTGAVAVLVAVSLAVLAQTLKSEDDFVYLRPNGWTWSAATIFVVTIVVAIGALFLRPRELGIAAAALGVIAVALWFVGIFRPSAREAYKAGTTGLHRAGIVAFLSGMALVLLAIVLSSRDQARPSIAAAVHEGPNGRRFTATVDANGLAAKQRMEILVEGIRPPRRTSSGAVVRDDKGRLIVDRTPLYGSVLGPNDQGEVKSKIEVPVVEGLNAIQIRAWIGDNAPAPCFTTGAIKKKQASPGCVTVSVPESDERPQLAASWIRTTSGVILSVHVTVHDVPLRVVDVSRQRPTGVNSNPVLLPRPTLLSVRVTGLPVPQLHAPPQVLYSALLAPNGKGSIDEALRLPIVGSFTAVCAEATLVPPSGNEDAVGPIGLPTKLACAQPQQVKIENTSTVWARLVMPTAQLRGNP